MTYDEFKFFYFQRGYCLGDSFKSKRSLNERQLLSKYNKFVEKEEKKKEKLKEQRRQFTQSSSIHKNNPQEFRQCALMRLLSGYDLKLLLANAGSKAFIVDSAHIFGKGASPHLKENPNDIIYLNRFSHECLDSSKDPITGEPITHEEEMLWWERIVGPEAFVALKKQFEMKHTNKRKEFEQEENADD